MILFIIYILFLGLRQECARTGLVVDIRGTGEGEARGVAMVRGPLLCRGRFAGVGSVWRWSTYVCG